MTYLNGDDLLAGGALTHDVIIPEKLLAGGGKNGDRVKMRPLTVRDVQRVSKAARDDDSLLSVLMLKEALVEPSLSLEQIHGLPTGLARFLIGEVNRVSGLSLDDESLEEAVQAPMARACFLLAREFGWSPQEVGDLTMGQVMLYLEMISRREEEG